MKSTKSVKKAQMGWVYGVIDMEGTLGYFDPMFLPITINGESMTLSDLINRLVAYENVHVLVTNKLNSLKSSVSEYLDEAGYDLPHEELNDIIEGIKAIEVLNPNDNNAIAIIKDGFISEIVDIEIKQVLRNEIIPDDIGLGYYKVEHGKIVVDIKRKEETLMTE